ncbi:OLC1v1008741C1 [Oldenlandia corymbosa var. corymbosa]|uniref:U-box domain-containing protein n=1 Tax=Oldenlandia corymbosa var. corymbosa TaxID=529605 RepID=A0AAV1DPT0_OLDCO|nr:OLC1v1008741C1 [Oldenlandia corymbosa var. corymbosa]
MVRQKNDLCISVPTFFRCPISLDVMKSPVSLSTGVTYDRSSIQRWLDGGNNTCPATMQVLQSKDFVPNHNLHRLIQIWSESVNTRPPGTSESATAAVNSVTPAEANIIIRQLKSLIPILVKGDNLPTHVNIFHQSLAKVILFAKISDETSNLVSSSGSELIPAIISSFCKLPLQIQANENVFHLIRILLKNYRRGRDEIVVDEKLVPTMLKFLRQGSQEVRISAAKLLKFVAESRDEYKTLICENEDVLKELLRLTMINSGQGDQETTEDCLTCLLTISTPKKNRARVVRSGAVIVLTEALHKGELNVKLVEKVLKLLELLSTCKEGRTEICRNEKCIEGTVKKVLKVSTLSTEHSVTILWSLCCLFRDPKAQEAVTKSNGMAKILLLIQSNVSPAVRQMCNDLLKVFKVQSRTSCLSSYDTKTTHIMPF